MEEDSYTKEETKSTKFVNLVHAASLNQASSAVSSNLGGTTGVTDLNSAYSGFDQDGPVAMEDDLADAHGWPSLSNSAWSKQHSHKTLNSQVRSDLHHDFMLLSGKEALSNMCQAMMVLPILCILSVLINKSYQICLCFRPSQYF